MNFWAILVPLCLLGVSQSRFLSKSDTGPYFFECELDPSQDGCKEKMRLQKQLSADGDEKPLPVPATIPERLQKYCKTDPESKFCVDLGLGKAKRRNLADGDKFSDDVAVTRGQEEEEEEEDSIEEYDTDRSGEEDEGKIDCEETPEHPGCMRNRYLDQFIAWKIGKDCEVDPNGPFCPKTLSSGCGNAPESSTPPPETSPESPKLSEAQKFFTRVLHKLLDDIRRDPTSKHSESTLPYVKRVMDILRSLQNLPTPSESSTESPVTTTTPQPESTTRPPFPVSFGDILREIFNVVKNSTSSGSPESPQSSDLGNLVRQILRSNRDPETVLNLLKDYWNQLKAEIEAEKAQNSRKYAPEVAQEVYIGQDSSEGSEASQVDTEDVEPIASYTGVIRPRSKSILNFY